MGMAEKICEGDIMASDILKAARYLNGYLGTSIYIEHVNSMTNVMASLTDELSRRELSEDPKEVKALEGTLFRPKEGFLLQWLCNPTLREEMYEGLKKELESWYSLYFCSKEIWTRKKNLNKS